MTLQWGALSAPAVSKLAANAWNGELSFLLLRHPFAAMAASLWLSAAGYVAGLWALGWEAGLRRTAPLLPLLAVAGTHLPLVSVNPDIVTKLQFFQDEDMGRTLAVIACAVAFAAMRERRGRTAPAVAGALLAAAALTHLIPVVAACALLIPYAIAFGVATRSLGRGIAVAVWTIGLAGLVTVASLFASGANLGFQGASGGAGYTDYRGRYDPTLAFKGVLAPPHPKAVDRWYEPPATTAHAYLGDALGRRAGGWRLSFVAVALVAVAAVAVALGPYDLRALAVAAAAMGLLLLAVALAFSYHYAYYIQATFGERRLLEYGALPILLLVLAALESVLDRVAEFDGRAAAVAAVAVLLAVLAAAAGDLRGGLGGLGPNADFVNAARIATPCDARILPDISTRGSFQALTGRASLLEGLAPFLRPTVLRRTLVVTEHARRFLHDPRGDTSFLAREHIDDVLVDRGGGKRWQRFDHTPGLRLVRQVGGVRVYRYTGPGAGRGGARPSDAPVVHLPVGSTGMSRRRLTRRQVLAAGAVAAVAAGGLAAERRASRGPAAPTLRVTGHEFQGGLRGAGLGSRLGASPVPGQDLQQRRRCDVPRADRTRGHGDGTADAGAAARSRVRRLRAAGHLQHHRRDAPARPDGARTGPVRIPRRHRRAGPG